MRRDPGARRRPRPVFHLPGAGFRHAPLLHSGIEKVCIMELKRLGYPYPYIPLSARAGILPRRSICSIAPAEDPSDALFTGNGSHRIDVTGLPYEDSLTANMELLQEPKWKETPRPPDLRPYLKDIRKALLEGRPEVADKLLEQAQREGDHVSVPVRAGEKLKIELTFQR